MGRSIGRPIKIKVEFEGLSSAGVVLEADMVEGLHEMARRCGITDVHGVAASFESDRWSCPSMWSHSTPGGVTDPGPHAETRQAIAVLDLVIDTLEREEGIAPHLYPAHVQYGDTQLRNARLVLIERRKDVLAQLHDAERRDG
jgi:hypothetical protein